MKRESFYPILRCKVCNVSTQEWPEKTNAMLIGGNDVARVLLDGKEQVESYSWSWIKFPVKKRINNEA